MEEELQERLERAFQTCGTSLYNVTAFKYLGRVMTMGDDDCTEVACNLQKARNNCGRMSRILIREGANTKVSGHFFKGLVQAVLLFGAET